MKKFLDALAPTLPYIILTAVLLLVLNKVGLIKLWATDEEKKSKSVLGTNSPINIRWASQQGGKKFRSAKQATIEASAKKLYNAKGTFNDDEQKLYSVFSGFANKYVAWQVAEKFNKLYGMDLQAFLGDFLNEKELSKLFDILNDLPYGSV